VQSLEKFGGGSCGQLNVKLKKKEIHWNHFANRHTCPNRHYIGKWFILAGKGISKNLEHEKPRRKYYHKLQNNWGCHRDDDSGKCGRLGETDLNTTIGC